MFKTYFLIFNSLFLSVASIAQCANIQLQSQSEIDEFQITFETCIDQSPSITIIGEDIVNLNGLLGIRRLDAFRILNAPNLYSLSGLDSIVYVGDLNLNSHLQELDGISNIETIINLSFRFNDFLTDLSGFSNLKDLSSLSTSGDGYLMGINNVLSNELIGKSTLIISNNHFKNDLKDILKPSNNYIKDLFIGGCVNLSLLGLQGVDTIDNFQILNSDSLDFKGLENVEVIKKIDWQLIDYETYNHNENIVFSKIESIDEIKLSSNSNIDSISSFLPNLKMVKSQLTITGNLGFNSLSPLEWSEPPSSYINETLPFRIGIVNNSDLESCDSYFLCRALEIYPDSIRVEANGMNCDLDYLIEDGVCNQILSNDEQDEVMFDVFPNPFTDVVNISVSDDLDYALKVYNLLGREVMHEQNTSQLVMSELPRGSYFLELMDLSSGKRVIKQLVKE